MLSFSIKYTLQNLYWTLFGMVQNDIVNIDGNYSSNFHNASKQATHCFRNTCVHVCELFVLYLFKSSIRRTRATT